MKVNWRSNRGVYIRESARDEWAEEALEKIEEETDKESRDFYNIHSGDTLIIAYRYGKRVDIFDCQIRRRASVDF